MSAQTTPERLAKLEVRLEEIQKRTEAHINTAETGFQRLTRVETAVFEMMWLMRAMGAALVAMAIKSIFTTVPRSVQDKVTLK